MVEYTHTYRNVCGVCVMSLEKLFLIYSEKQNNHYLLFYLWIFSRLLIKFSLLKTKVKLIHVRTLKQCCYSSRVVKPKQLISRREEYTRRIMWSTKSRIRVTSNCRQERLKCSFVTRVCDNQFYSVRYGRIKIFGNRYPHRLTDVIKDFLSVNLIYGWCESGSECTILIW